jgi:hypothetical protein
MSMKTLFNCQYSLSKISMRRLRKIGHHRIDVKIYGLAMQKRNHRNCQTCITTGPNIDIATKLIKRTKNIFERKLGLNFQDKETVF